ncbi:5-demethoxyubiquinol-8 5-hydroxylase UbiM [Maricurvus nonylphenolicus]|uniref:5-demethoxyubiquinol-8 5-hydroxylase UbiM n=1 Tax=Maricurvus nonylphenolicus TaxID=1008307 RepID=UPI0036F2981E
MGAVKQVDIAVIGAGPAGLSLACALASSGLQLCLIDPQSKAELSDPPMDGRDIAMTHLSKTILMEMGVWQRFESDVVHPLCEATVQDGSSPYALHFERSDDPDAPLGYLVANHQIRKALFSQAQTLKNVDWLYEQSVISTSASGSGGRVVLDNGDVIEASLVVSADSRFSTTRRMMGIGAKMKDFGRVMIVCNMTHPGSHRNTAQECFYYGRTCAILPLGENTSSIVITVPAAKAEELTSSSPEDFESCVSDMLEHRLGKLTLVSERFSYPLVGAYADKFVSPGYALIGDAAVGMHPVTAHGYNLGLRSADTLAKQILKAKQQGKDIGSLSVLQGYEWRHQLLAKPLYESTNMIVRLYTDDRPLAKLARKAAIRVGNNIAPFKKLVTHRLTQIR